MDSDDERRVQGKSKNQQVDGMDQILYLWWLVKNAYRLVERTCTLSPA